MTYKYINEVFDNMSFDFSLIDGIIITHEHTDHIKGLNMIIKKHHPDIYMSPKLAKVLDINNYIDIYNENNINGINYEVINTSHDAIDPIGIIFKTNNEKIVHITDSGYLNKNTVSMCHNANFYLIESNYEDSVIMSNTNYPLKTRQRIMSEKGHLSNLDCARYLHKMVGNNTTHVLFAHMSVNNNNDDLILEHNQDLDVEHKIVLKKDQVIEVEF